MATHFQNLSTCLNHNFQQKVLRKVRKHIFHSKNVEMFGNHRGAPDPQSIDDSLCWQNSASLRWQNFSRLVSKPHWANPDTNYQIQYSDCIFTSPLKWSRLEFLLYGCSIYFHKYLMIRARDLLTVNIRVRGGIIFVTPSLTLILTITLITDIQS